MTERGQAFTIEAITAALLLLGSVVFITQAPGVTPLSTSPAGSDLPGQQRDLAAGLLDAAAHQDELRPTLLYWNNSTHRFHGASEDDNFYIDDGPPTAFGDRLQDVFDDRDTAYNIDLAYVNETGQIRRTPLVRQGSATRDAVRVSHVITLFDDDVLVDSNENKTQTQLADVNETFYAPDAAPDSPVYTVVRVEVVVWRV